MPSLQAQLRRCSIRKRTPGQFINLIYSNQEVFSLHDKDMGNCDKLTHYSDKPVYLPHRTIPRQLQGEVHECLNIWLCQGIIHPSNSPYASQVVIVHKKSGEIHLCVDYRKLNSITIRDAFPLPCIGEALQALHSHNVFTSFDLAQEYLQLARQKMASRRLQLEQVLQAYMSLPICLLACQMPGQASAG